MNPSIPENITSPKLSAPVTIDCSDSSSEGTNMAASDPSNTESHDESPSPRSATRWRTPLLWAAGADTDDLSNTNRAERARVGSQGALLILIGIISAGSALLMMSVIGTTSLAVAIPASIVWGLVVFVATRMATQTYSVATEPPSRRWTAKRVLGIAPLAILLTLIAIMVGQMAMLSIAERDIDVRLAENRSREIAELAQSVPQMGSFAEQSGTITRDLQAAVAAADRAVAAEEQARLEFENAITGIAGTGTGEGPDTQRAREQYSQATAQVQQTQTDLVAAQDRAASAREALGRAIDAEVSERAASIEDNDGLVARSEALDDIAAESTTLTLIRWWLTITFILVFLAPLFLSLSTPRRRQAAPLPAAA